MTRVRGDGTAGAAGPDGSVRFPRETIDSRQSDPRAAVPLGVTRDDINKYIVARDAKVAVYQRLTTRREGEAISDGDYLGGRSGFGWHGHALVAMPGPRKAVRMPPG